MTDHRQHRHLGEVCGAFFALGLVSFGGPVAHLGYFHTAFVERRRWLSSAEYGELVSICQFLPGPASSQVAFALGMHRAGLAGALGASICFLLPSALLMIAFGLGLGAIPGLAQAGWVRGLGIAAVAIVAHAVGSMAPRLCPDAMRRITALIAACIILLVPDEVVPAAWRQVAVIAIAGVAGAILLRGSVVRRPLGEHSSRRGRRSAVAALVCFALLLLLTPALARTSGSPGIIVFDSLYRAGALVFGGGHVVLPLLRAELVPAGLISDDAFLAAYGAAQAIPGPLFALAGALGAMIDLGLPRWLGGVWALLAIFLPAWLLVGGALPLWGAIRRHPGAQAAVLGANAAVVGVLAAALISPVIAEGIRTPADLAIAAAALVLLVCWKAPPIAVVGACAVAGQIAGSL